MDRILLATRMSAAVAMAVLVAPSLALAGDLPAPGVTVAAPDGDAVALAAAIRAELANQPAGASAADLEAAIVFRISQGSYTDSVLSDALDRVGAVAPSARATAIQNVRLALLKRKLKRGTAAIGDGGYGSSAGTGSGGGFTSPGTSTGGGSSNYTR